MRWRCGAMSSRHSSVFVAATTLLVVVRVAVVVGALASTHNKIRRTGSTSLKASSREHDEAEPTLDDFWEGRAYFAPHVSHAVHAAGFEGVDAGTRVVVAPNGTWYLFGRSDTGATPACPQGEIGINVRASNDKGLTWGAPSTVVHPADPGANSSACLYADGTAFFDADAGQDGNGLWHYLVQALDTAHGGWCLSHFTLEGPSPLQGPWQANPHNPVVVGGQLFNQICTGPGKHCDVGMRDEGTPEIVSKVGGDFYVTFHGYDYDRRAAARGVARTPDFVNWEVTGGADALPGDVIFAAADCADWDVPWALPNGCIGSGEASILRSGSSGYMYQVIEATDEELTCDLRWGAQWWPLGIVRSKTWAATPQWEQMPVDRTPLVGGPRGNEPHVGCSIQYNSLHQDPAGGGNGSVVYFAFWDVSFHTANASDSSSSWNIYKLAWSPTPANSTLDPPMRWPGPPQRPVNCSTEASCEATCTQGFATCSDDGHYYCCDAAAECTTTHTCSGTPGLDACACGTGPLCPTASTCRTNCPGFVQCEADGWFYCCGSPNCTQIHACASNPGLEDCACGPS